MIRVETHLFGSVDGYRTLARTEGVSDAEDAALSAMGFGSPRSGAEFESLAERPCMAGRLLASGRYAITRLFAGDPDVAGRQTVERRTLILTSDQWLEACRCDLHATLLAPSVWRRHAFAAGEPVDLPLMPCQDLLPEPTESDRRAYDALLTAHASGRCAILPDEPRWHQAMLRLAGLLAPSQAIATGWGVGLWNVPQGVWLCTLRQAGVHRNAFVAPTAGVWRHAEAVQRLGSGLPARPQTGQRSAPEHVRQGRGWLWALAIALLLLGVAGLVWLIMPKASVTAPGTDGAVVRTPEAPATPPPDMDTSRVPAAAKDPPEPPKDPPPAAPPPVAEEPSGKSDANPYGGGTVGPSGFGQTQSAVSGAREPAEPSATPPSDANSTSTPQPETPGSGPAPSPGPSPAPNIPPTHEPDSTPWDDATKLLERSIDVLRQARTAADATGPDALRQRMDAAESLLAIARETTSAAQQVNAQFRVARQTDLALVDLNSRTVPADAAARLAEATASPDLLRQSALLVARFAQMVAARRLDAATGDVTDPDDPWTRKRNELAKAKLTEWPSEAFARWFVARPDVRKNMARSIAATQVAELIRSAVEGQQGREDLSRALRDAANALIKPDNAP
jgi:hypothetical protein